MRFELFVALRYLIAQRKGLFAWVTTVIGVAGVSVGVAALITTLSVMNGFQKDIRAKVIGAQSHVVVYGATDPESASKLAARVAKDPAVQATAPFAAGQAILYVNGRTTGAVVKGLDPALEFKTNELKGTIQDGSWDDLTGEKGLPGIVLGQELAKNLNLWKGEKVILLSPEGAATPLGVLPKTKAFKVAGFLKTGYYEYDASMAYVPLEAAHAFFGPNAQYGVQARLKSIDETDEAAERLKKELGWAHPVRTFKDLNRTLFGALKLEKFVMFTILTLIVLVAAFNIASTLILLTTEKVRDIGLLKSMGLSPARIQRVFLLEGLLIGLAGVGAGTALGLALSWVIGHYQIVELPADIYYLSRVPVSVQAGDVTVIVLGSVALCLLGALYPAVQASRVSPVEAIHYG